MYGTYSYSCARINSLSCRLQPWEGHTLIANSRSNHCMSRVLEVGGPSGDFLQNLRPRPTFLIRHESLCCRKCPYFATLRVKRRFNHSKTWGKTKQVNISKEDDLHFDPIRGHLSHQLKRYTVLQPIKLEMGNQSKHWRVSYGGLLVCYNVTQN